MNADIDTASVTAAQAFSRALFGNHPLARTISKSDLARVTRSNVDSWVGRVHNLHNAALVVVGEVDAAEVQRYAEELSVKIGAPAWVDQIPAVPPPAFRPPGSEHLMAVVTPRAGRLTEVRMGCLLPPMTVASRPSYDMLRLAIEERLSTALRFERGAGYALQVSYESLRGGAAYLQIGTFLDAESLADSLAAWRVHWRRWSHSGFDAGEMNVARWLYIGQLSLAYSTNHAIAYQLFSDWNADPSAPGRESFRGDPNATDPARLNQLFATCKANAVLGLTGPEAVIRKALRLSWPLPP